MTTTLPKFVRPLIFGVINVTPDSFSDGGEFFSVDAVMARMGDLLSGRADYIDLGAESTRPGAAPVSEDIEWQRLGPVLSAIQTKGLNHLISVDTRHPKNMLRCAELGVGWINCVGPLPDDDVLSGLKKCNSKIGFVATHVHGQPESMHLNPLSVTGALKRVHAFFETAHADLIAAGFQGHEILLDPGIGFGKSDAANVALMASCSLWSKQFPVAMGVSRKGFFHRALNIPHAKDRDGVSKVTESVLALSGAKMIRTHDVATLSRCFDLLAEAMQ